MRPARPRFAVLLPAPLRHAQTSSACGFSSLFLVGTLCFPPFRAASRRSRARSPFTASARSISPASRPPVIGPCALRRRNWRFRNSVRNASTSASVTRPQRRLVVGKLHPRRGQQHRPHPFRERHVGLRRAHSSRAANSSSLTFVPMDFVRSGAFIAHRRFDCVGIGFRPHAGRVPQRAGQRAERSRFLAKGRGVIKLPLQQRQVAIRVTRFQRFFLLAACFLMVPAPVTFSNFAATRAG
jgi:hypothetical protein